MATRKITYLDPSPKYMRTRTPSTASIMSTSKLLGPPGTRLTPEPNYLSESAQRVRIPTPFLPSSIPQLQDLSTRNIQGLRMIDTSAGEGAFQVSQAGLEGFGDIGKALGRRFFPRTAVDLAVHSQRQSGFTSIPGGSEPPPPQQTGFFSRLFG